MKELADLIDGAKALKLHGVHGIRWVASIRNVLAKVYRMLHLIVIDLDERAKFGFGGRARTMRTSDEMFQFIVTYLPYMNGDENISLDR